MGIASFILVYGPSQPGKISIALQPDNVTWTTALTAFIPALLAALATWVPLILTSGQTQLPKIAQLVRDGDVAFLLGLAVLKVVGLTISLGRRMVGWIDIPAVVFRRCARRSNSRFVVSG